MATYYVEVSIRPNTFDSAHTYFTSRVPEEEEE